MRCCCIRWGWNNHLIFVLVCFCFSVFPFFSFRFVCNQCKREVYSIKIISLHLKRTNAIDFSGRYMNVQFISVLIYNLQCLNTFWVRAVRICRHRRCFGIGHMGVCYIYIRVYGTKHSYIYIFIWFTKENAIKYIENGNL